ncbi:hypothetical protein DB345_16015 [Spartobacteria bacterium LR76]|nr:hypothetical protein DB345_16015 [Spartobacteria bacterium LR76]
MVVLFAGMTLGLAQSPAPAPKVLPLQRSFSSSQQFIIYNNDKILRARLARQVEDIKASFLRRLGLSDEWKSPIIIRVLTLRSSNQPKIITNAFESDGDQLKLQIDVFEPAVIGTADFDIEIYRALCLEYQYRNYVLKAGKQISQPPAWLIEALYEESRSKEEGPAAGLYEMLLQRGNSPKLEAFLKEKPTMYDGTSRAIYRAQAVGLLRAIMAFQGAQASLCDYLSKLPEKNAADAKELIKSFPAIEQDPSLLAKAWVLSIADVSAANRLDPMTIDETRKQLALILDLSAPPNPKKPDEKPVRGPMAFPEIARTPEGRYVIDQKKDDLLRLEVRSHPLLRPMVAEYRLIATQLVAKPKRNVRDRLEKNQELLDAVSQRANEVEDYLNWYEAAKLETPSGHFNNVTDEPTFQKTRRSDAISRRLDDLEAQGW